MKQDIQRKIYITVHSLHGSYRSGRAHAEVTRRSPHRLPTCWENWAGARLHEAAGRVARWKIRDCHPADLATQ